MSGVDFERVWRDSVFSKFGFGVLAVAGGRASFSGGFMAHLHFYQQQQPRLPRLRPSGISKAERRDERGANPFAFGLCADNTATATQVDGA